MKWILHGPRCIYSVPYNHVRIVSIGKLTLILSTKSENLTSCQCIGAIENFGQWKPMCVEGINWQVRVIGVNAKRRFHNT